VKRREQPIKRVNPSGEVRWVARYTNSAGKRKQAGTFARKREAQEAIDAAYARPERLDTFGAYALTWTERHPRSAQTNASSRTRLNAVIEIEIEGRPLRDWPYIDLKPKHMVALVDHLLRIDGRAAKGVQGIKATISSMNQDAITDDVAEINFAFGVKVRTNDPRIRKAPKKINVWSFDQLREFAAAGRPETRAETAKPSPDRKTGETLYYSRVDFEPMLATLCLSNLRIGELFALLRSELDLTALTLQPSGSAYEGVITRGNTREKKHEGLVPIAPSLAVMLERIVPRIDTQLLFPTAKGTVWHDSNFRRDVWRPAQIASGLPIQPHECRHSYVSHMRAEGVDAADLAQVTRHSIDTATRHYTHPLDRSMEQIRGIIG
jgi:integrase